MRRPSLRRDSRCSHAPPQSRPLMSSLPATPAAPGAGLSGAVSAAAAKPDHAVPQHGNAMSKGRAGRPKRRTLGRCPAAAAVSGQAFAR